MKAEDRNLVVIRVRGSLEASELRLTHGVTPELLSATTQCRPCLPVWGRVVGEILPPGSGQMTTFARVPDQPHLLAFRQDLLEIEDSGLPLFLDGGRDLLPVDTPQGGYVLWHALHAGNALDRTKGWENGRLVTPHFIRHRIGPAAELSTNVGCSGTHIFMKQYQDDLPPTLGGPAINGHPPPGWRMRDCRSLAQEYFWRGWTGLEFEIVWRSGSRDV